MLIQGGTPRRLAWLGGALAWLVLAGGLAWSAPAAAKSPRAALHDGYGRMVFDWEGTVAYTATVDGSALVVRFGRPVAGELGEVVAALSPYLSGVEVNPDRTVATFALTRPVRVRAFTVGSAVVVDLLDRGAEPAPATREPAPVTVTVQASEHGGHTRLAFEWKRPVDYKVDKQGDRAMIAFSRPGQFELGRLVLPADLAIAEATGGERPQLTLTMPASARLRHFRNGSAVVVDVVRPTPEAAAAPSPAAPRTSEAAASRPGVAARKPDEKKPEDSGRQPAMLTFPFTEPTGAAIFRRAGWLWLVFDRRIGVDPEQLRRAGGNLVEFAEQLPHADATVLRLLLRPDLNPVPRREGAAWLLDLLPQPLRPAAPIVVEPRRTGDDQPAGLFLTVTDGGPAITLRDPEVGDSLVVVPVQPLGSGVAPARSFAELDLLATGQGIAVVSRAEGVQLRSTRDGVEIALPGGGISIGEDQFRGVAPDRSEAPAEILDLVGWARGATGDTEAGKRQAHGLLATALPGQRNGARAELARHYLAVGYGAEALGVLKAMVTEDAAVEQAPTFRALRGAALLLMGRSAEALADFDQPGLAGSVAVTLWKAIARAAQGDAGIQAAEIRGSIEALHGYPEPVLLRLGEIAAVAVLEAGDDKLARIIIDMIAAVATTPMERAKLAYLEGAYHNLTGDFDKALEQWRAAEQGPSRPHRARSALGRIELELKLGRISPAQAEEAMDRLRFAWRGDTFEFELLRRLGEIRIAHGDYGSGLRTLRSLASHHGQNKDIGAIGQLMSDTFAKLYLDGGAEALPAVTAIGLFDEFRELTPSGDKGDEMIRRLADRLVAVDLLDQAADLLRHQVAHRLQGEARSRVGTRLAVLELLNRRPERATEALRMSEAAEAPAELKAQRRHLQARAEHEQGHGDAALALLADDASVNARLLRAEILWTRKDWPRVAETLEGLVAEPAPEAPLDADSARIVLHLATALTLANDDRGIDRLRQRYGASMAATPYRNAFTLLTAEAKRGVIDHRSVGDKIREAESFQTFMATYRKRLQSEGLSAIN